VPLDDPRPAFSSASRENVEIDCWFGSYYKIGQEYWAGWVVRSAIAMGYRPRDCNLFDWWPWPGSRAALIDTTRSTACAR
jgi:hypothetical protein